jgi:hypothetical protein
MVLRPVMSRERAEHTAEHADRWRDRHAARKQIGEWADKEADAQQRWTAHVAPQIAFLEQEIRRHQTTLERTAARLDRQQAASTAVVEYGLQHQRRARHLATQLGDYRDNIDGVPTPADVRRAATSIEQRRGVAAVADPGPPVTRHAAPEL